MMNLRISKPIRHTKPSPHQKEEDSPALLLRHTGLSFLITLLTGAALILVGSLVAYFQADPDRWILPIGLLASGATALIGGMVAARIHGHSALICGLLTGSLTLCVMMLLSLCFAGLATGYSAGISCLIHTAFLGLSVLGAFLGLPHHNKKKKKRVR